MVALWVVAGAREGKQDAGGRPGGLRVRSGGAGQVDQQVAVDVDPEDVDVAAAAGAGDVAGEGDGALGALEGLRPRPAQLGGGGGGQQSEGQQGEQRTGGAARSA